MIENTTEGEKPHDGDAIALGDLSYNDVGKFLSIYISALRGYVMAYETGGLPHVIKTAGQLLQGTLLAADPAMIGPDEAHSAQKNMRVATMAIGHALSTCLSKSDPRDIAAILVSAEDAITEIAIKMGDKFTESHIVIMAKPGQSGIRLSVFNAGPINNEKKDGKYKKLFDKVEPKILPINPQNN